MVAVERIAHVEKVERNDMRRMLLREQVRTREIEDGVARCRRLRQEDAILVIRHHYLGIQQQSLVPELQSDTPAQRRNPWQRRVA